MCISGGATDSLRLMTAEALLATPFLFKKCTLLTAVPALLHLQIRTDQHEASRFPLFAWSF